MAQKIIFLIIQFTICTSDNHLICKCNFKNKTKQNIKWIFAFILANKVYVFF